MLGALSLRRAGRPLAGLALVLALGVAVVAAVPPGGSTAADPPSPSSLRAEEPYVPLFTQAGACAANRAVNELTGTELERALGDLRRWYVHFHSPTPNVFGLGEDCQGTSETTLAGKLTASGALVSHYRNGSYVSQAQAGQLLFGEAADLEAGAPLAIATFWAPESRRGIDSGGGSEAARLALAVGASDTVLRVTSAAAFRPEGAASTWPFVASRGTGTEEGAHSANTRDFVSWVRIGDEIAQVAEAPVEESGIVTLTVRRGIWGTAAADHDRGARVVTPAYIGSASGAPSDSNLSGNPQRNDPNFALRYAIKIWQPDGYGWIARRIRSTFGPELQGHNAVWLDVSSCTQYNQADAYGQPVVGWDDPRSAPLTDVRWGEHQKTKLHGLRAALPGVRFLANNLGANPGECTDGLLTAYDGGALENWVRPGSGASWQNAMAQSFRIQAGDWPALYWPRWNSVTDPASYRRFSYGSLLLTYRPSSQKFQYGGPFGLGQPDELFFWDWGAPLSLPSSAEDVAVPGTGLYRRDFQHGIVVVNPSASERTYALDGTYRDVNRTGADGQPAPVTSVTIPAGDAAFLLRTPDDTSPPDTSIERPPGQHSARPAALLGGGATDDTGVTAVWVDIQNTATGRWWRTDGTWGAADSHPATLANPGGPSTSWTFTWEAPPSGTFLVRAVAGDAAGNRDPSPAEARVRVTGGRLGYL